MAKATTRHRRRSMTVPVAVLAGMVPLAVGTVQQFRLGGPEAAAGQVVGGLTGYELKTGKWNPANMAVGLYPILLGFGVHWMASKFGVNRALARAGVPFVRI
jgi:hypothetical protein